VSDLILKDEAYRIIGACFEVYNELGSGFLEPVYQECLEHEFRLRQIPFFSQPIIPITYKGVRIQKAYQADLLCFDQIIVELKAVSAFNDVFRAQIFNYLRATEMPLGLLVNFGATGGVQHERFALTRRSS
jgi:GxxExxY protein